MLFRSLRESGENLRLLGADIALTVKGVGNIPFAYALCAYDLYEKVVESTVDILSAMFIRLTLNGEKLVLSLQLGVNGAAEDALAKLVACGELSIEFEENDVYVDLTMGGDGR